MNKYPIAIASFIALMLPEANSVENPDYPEFQILATTDPTVVTNELSSGELILGISSRGGGFINRLYLPGIGDVMGPESARYGRGGQSSIRDEMHGRCYNPTQAGFSDPAGTICRVVESEDGSLLTIVPRPCVLFRGDNKFDFTEWENLADDRYKENDDALDLDTIDESDLPGRQATEVTSEFDYYCTYEDRMGKSGYLVAESDRISIPAIRHYYEFRYVRDPGHCILQHVKGPLFDPVAGHITDISISSPEGVHESSENDMGVISLSTSIRMDRDLWTPAYLGIVDPDDLHQLQFFERGENQFIRGYHKNTDIKMRATGYEMPNYATTRIPLMIYADSTDMEKGNALGLYFPQSDINQFSLIGMSKSDGSIVYKEDRRLLMELRDTPLRTRNMQWCGFRVRLLGILNPTRLPVDQYEAIRGEFYMLYGTPGQILETARRIQPF